MPNYRSPRDEQYTTIMRNRNGWNITNLQQFLKKNDLLPLQVVRNTAADRGGTS